MNDNEYIQRIIDTTKERVIPHINPRTGKPLWEISSPLVLSSGCRGSLRFGDKSYWTLKPAQDGDMSDISVDGVICRSEHAVIFCGGIPRLTLKNITNTYESGDILVQYR